MRNSRSAKDRREIGSRPTKAESWVISEISLSRTRKELIRDLEGK